MASPDAWLPRRDRTATTAPVLTRRTADGARPGPAGSASRLTAVLRQDRCALGVFLPAGYPTLATGIEAALIATEHGGDIVEIGWPHLSPAFDGPLISAAYRHVLRRGDGLEQVVATVTAVADCSTAPVVVVAYWQDVAADPQRVARRLAAAGAAGCMVPDVPAAQAPRWFAAARRSGMHAPVFTPQWPPASSVSPGPVATGASGWVYLPAALHAHTGYTGPLDVTGLRAAARRVARQSGLPVVTGVGISSPRLAGVVAPAVDAVMVGTAAVAALTDAPAWDGLRRLGRLTASYAEAVHTARPLAGGALSPVDRADGCHVDRSLGR